MAYTFHEQVLGQPGADTTDTTQQTGMGRVMRASDSTYGEAQLIYLKATAALTQGQVVSYSAYNKTAVLWTGTAGSGLSLAVSLGTVASGSFGWFAVFGAVPVAISGTITAGAPLYWQANGTLSSTQVNGKMVMGAIPATAAGVPSAGLAVVELSFPKAQGQVV